MSTLSDAALVVLDSARAVVDGDALMVELTVPGWADAARAALLVRRRSPAPAGYEGAQPPAAIIVAPEWTGGPEAA